MSPPFVVSWFYLATKEAAPILKRLFETGGGVRPGAVILVSAEDLAILRDGVAYYPVNVKFEDTKIIAPGLAH